MPRFVRYHAVIPLGSFTLKNTPPIPVTCSTSFPLAAVSLDSRCCNAAPALVLVVAAATQSTATAPANAPKRRLRTSIFLFITFIGVVCSLFECENRCLTTQAQRVHPSGVFPDGPWDGWMVLCCDVHWKNDWWHSAEATLKRAKVFSALRAPERPPARRRSFIFPTRRGFSLARSRAGSAAV